MAQHSINTLLFCSVRPSIETSLRILSTHWRAFIRFISLLGSILGAGR